LIAQRFESFVSKSTSFRPEHSLSNVQNSFVSHVKFADYFFKLRDTSDFCRAMALGSSESAAHSILFHFVWNQMNRDANIVAHLSIGTKISGQQNQTGFVDLFSVVSVDDLCSYHGRCQRGASGARPPILNLWPRISRLAPGCSIHPITYFQNVSPLLAFNPQSGFWHPLLLNPGDAPGSHASYHHCGKVINVRETYFCEKLLTNYTLSWVFQKYFNSVPMPESRNVDHMKGNCSWDMILWINSGGLHSFMSFSNTFQLWTHARIKKCASREK